MGETPKNDAPPPLTSPYWPSVDGDVLLYAGPMNLADGDADTWVADGDVIFNPYRRPALQARFTGSESWILDMAMSDRHPSVALPEGVLFAKSPIDTVTTESSEDTPQWFDYDIPLNSLQGGDLSRAHKVILCISGDLASYPVLPKTLTREGPQGQITLTLPGWRLRLAEPLNTFNNGFRLVVEATPNHLPIGDENLHSLVDRTFMLLRFVRGGGIAIDLQLGLGSDEEIVWTNWAAGRKEAEGRRWCPEGLVRNALPKIAAGISLLASDPGLEACVERSLSLLLAVNENGVLDTKIPTTCSGLELLAWAVLQHKQWMTTDVMSRLPAAARLRLLLQWAEIPTDLPDSYTALKNRRKTQGNPEQGGPELIFNIRNSLVHPPKRTTDPEWPSSGELIETYILSTWYLETALLRVLGYDGEYAPRLMMEGWVGDTRPLPWVAPDQALKGPRGF